MTATAQKLQLPASSHVPKPYTGPGRDELVAMRKQFTNPAIFHLYKEPLLIVEGHMQYLYDDTGARYLDLFAGIVTVSVGHCHPAVTKAVVDQAQLLQHSTTIYLNPNFPLLAKKLASKMPKGLDVTYFVNTGSEANDLAIQMARLYTGNRDVIALRNAYHGGSPTGQGLTSHSTWKYPVGGDGFVHHVVNPDPYRSPFSGSPEEIARQSAAEIRETIRYSTSGKVAAFIAEPINGVGGATAGAKNYLAEAYAVVREAGGLCVADEVQTGFGRTGENYWGFQNYGVTPDFVTMAKGFGNGIPLAAVTTRMEIAKVLAQKTHFNTFGGNPIAMAAGLAVIDVIDAEGIQENAKVLGARFRKGLEKLAATHEIIGDVRGMGLMIGVELVRDRGSKEPAKSETLDILECCRENSVLIGKGGLDGNTLRIKPPMCITADDVDYALDVLDIAFTRVRQS
ncbi:MAG: alanine--glyoxylate aminotransferase 2 1, mitochondrial [Gemmatimonadetes bacterium]|nr:alanine--glyoxylate aminotransferase 2 1, mitochondrial [Gemmatimonadota bacterium]